MSHSQPMHTFELISVMPSAFSEQGNFFGYHRTIGEVVRSIGGIHTGWMHEAAPINPLPADWSRCLKLPLARRARRSELAALVYQLARLISTRSSRTTVLFIEFLSLDHVLALIIAAILAKHPKVIHLWIVFHFRIDKREIRRLHRVLALWRFFISRNNVALFSVSSFIAKWNSEKLEENVRTVANLHTRRPNETEAALAQQWRRTQRPDRIICWWPGRPAKAKGLHVVQMLAASESSSANRIHLVLSEAAQIERVGSMHVERVPDTLTAQDYYTWMAATDIVLLPYRPIQYAERISGIFTEAVTAGRMTLVSDGTWMAHELRRYGYPEFIVEWSRPDLIDHILRMAYDANASARIRQFGDAFQRENGQQAFAKQIQNLLTVSQRSS